MPRKPSQSAASQAQTNPQRRRDVAPFRSRRRQEPAAAPFDTDDEAGNVSGRYAGAPLGRVAGEPVDPVAQASAHETHQERDGEVRAGPGDAGRQDRPERLPPAPPRRRSGRAVFAALVLFISGLAVMAVWWIGAV